MGTILGWLWHLRRFAAINSANLRTLAILIHDGVSWVEWVRASLRFALHLGHIRVVITCETASVLSWLVPLLSPCSSNIIDLHWVTSGSTLHNIGLRPALVDIVDGHCVANEFGGSSWAHLHLRNHVRGIQRVISLPLRLELDDLGLGTLQILRPQIGLLLNKADMEGARARSVNIPVRVGELLLVNLFRAVKLGYRTYSTDKIQFNQFPLLQITPISRQFDFLLFLDTVVHHI